MFDPEGPWSRESPVLALASSPGAQCSRPHLLLSGAALQRPRMMAVGTEDPREGPISFSHCPRGSLGAGVTSLTPSLPSSSLSAAEGLLATRPGGERRATNSLAEAGSRPQPRGHLWRGQAQSRGQTLSILLQAGNLGCQGNLANTLRWSHSLKPLLVEQSAGWFVAGQRTRAQMGTRGTPGSLPPLSRVTRMV